MTISQILQWAKSQSGEHGDLIGIEVLLSFILGKGREFLISHSEFQLSEDQEGRFFDLFRRFRKGEPVAYLINQKEFFGLDFYVDKRVLIPRPETELLVEKILALVKNGKLPTTAKILEVGTGSGCISVALAKNNSDFHITAVDISTDALSVAKLNAKKHDVETNISFRESDLLSHLDEQYSNNPFDVIVANLPYIGRSRFNLVSKETHDYEPHLALFAGEDGFLLYEKLFQQIGEKKWKPAFILGEFGFAQREELENIILKNFPPNANALEFFADYAKIDRVFMISKL
jgi:release factor glutamine methyltransferase